MKRLPCVTKQSRASGDAAHRQQSTQGHPTTHGSAASWKCPMSAKSEPYGGCSCWHGCSWIEYSGHRHYLAVVSTSSCDINILHFARWVDDILYHGSVDRAFVCCSHHDSDGLGDPDGSASSCCFSGIFAMLGFSFWMTDFYILIFFRGSRVFDFYIVDCCDRRLSVSVVD